MKVGNVEVEQKLGTVRFSDLLVEMPDVVYRGWDNFFPVMRGERELYQDRLIEVGVQHKINLKDIVSLNNKFEVDPAIQLLFGDFDFFKVALVADFSPKQRLKFVRGKLRIELSNQANGQPIVYSIAPLKIDDQIKKTKKFGVAPSLKLFDIELDPGVEYVSETSCEAIHPQIIGHYSAESWAEWDYMTTDKTKEIVGTQIMELIIKQPVNIVSKAQVQIEGKLDWRNISARLKGYFLKGEFKPDSPSPDFETFTIP